MNTHLYIKFVNGAANEGVVDLKEGLKFLINSDLSVVAEVIIKPIQLKEPANV